MHCLRQSPHCSRPLGLFRNERRPLPAGLLRRPWRDAQRLSCVDDGREIQVNEAKDLSRQDLAEDDVRQLRVDLAAAFRLAVEFDWHESVGNHFSAAVSADGKRFLMNPRWRHFGSIRASDLMLLDADDEEVMNRPDAPDPSACTIHGTIHRRRPSARVLLHCHPPYATALSALKDPSMKPIDNNTARFFGSLAIDQDFGGI